MMLITLPMPPRRCRFISFFFSYFISIRFSCCLVIELFFRFVCVTIFAFHHANAIDDFADYFASLAAYISDADAAIFSLIFHAAPHATFIALPPCQTAISVLRFMPDASLPCLLMPLLSLCHYAPVLIPCFCRCRHDVCLFFFFFDAAAVYFFRVFFFSSPRTPFCRLFLISASPRLMLLCRRFLSPALPRCLTSRYAAADFFFFFDV